MTQAGDITDQPTLAGLFKRFAVPEDPARGPVAVIEVGAIGGTCINRGCIPSKILVYTADVASGPGRRSPRSSPTQG